MVAMGNSSWYVYVIRATDGSLYTGITTDVERRFTQHKNKQGAKYFLGRTPQEVVYKEGCSDRSQASQREYAIKALTKKQKEKLIANYDRT